MPAKSKPAKSAATITPDVAEAARKAARNAAARKRRADAKAAAKHDEVVATVTAIADAAGANVSVDHDECNALGEPTVPAAGDCLTPPAPKVNPLAVVDFTPERSEGDGLDTPAPEVKPAKVATPVPTDAEKLERRLNELRADGRLAGRIAGIRGFAAVPENHAGGWSLVDGLTYDELVGIIGTCVPLAALKKVACLVAAAKAVK